MTGPLFPTNYTRIWVRGTFIDLAGNPKSGTVVLTPSPSVLLNLAPKLIISGRPFSAQLDPQTGHFSLQVPASDDPDITPTQWTYRVNEPSGRSYDIVVPINTPVLNAPGDPLHGQQVVDLIDIVPAPTPSAGTVQLISGRGIASMTINGSNHLIVVYTDGTTQDLGNTGGAGGGVSEQYVDDSIAAHVASAAPHPTYDDLPSLTLLFENGLI